MQNPPTVRARIGVVGLNHGYALALSIHACPTVELAAVCVRHARDHRDKLDRLKVPIFESIDSMLDGVQLDGVVLAAPTNQLVAMTKRCLAHGITVLVEKPLAIRAADAAELKDVASATSRVIVGYHRRLSPQVIALKSLLCAGVIGDVRAVTCKWLIRKPAGYFNGWRSVRASGGGCLMINAVHEIDTLQYLLGPIEAVSALESNPSAVGDVEHFITVTMRFRQGGLGTAIFSDQCPSPYSYENTVASSTKFPRYPVDILHLFGTTGTLAFPSFALYSIESAEDTWAEALSASKICANEGTDDPLMSEIERFAEVIRGRGEPHATIDDAIQNLAVVEAIRRSIASATVERVQGRR